MINRLISSELMSLVHKSLDAASLQHKAISNNLANVDTPGFKRSEAVFQEKLKQAIDRKAQLSTGLQAARTNPGHIAFTQEPDLAVIQPELQTQNQSTLRNDQNNVDIDVEMAKLAQNTVVYQTLAQMAQGQFAELRSAITEGRR